jgi:DNA-binding transcriptional regulator YiaG
LTPTDLKHARRQLGLSLNEFARAVGVATGRTVRKWEDGDRDIPGPVITILELAEEFPAVESWLRRVGRSPDET